MHNSIESQLRSALSAYEIGDFTNAEIILTKILLAHSQVPLAFHLMGLIRASQLKHHEAIKLFKKGIELDPNDALLFYNLARALQDAGADQESLQYHQNAIKLSLRLHDG